MTLQTQVEVKGCFYTGAVGCGNLRTTRTVLTQYCCGTEQIFTVKGSFDIASFTSLCTMSGSGSDSAVEQGMELLLSLPKRYGI